jgi:hypothetical protein
LLFIYVLFIFLCLCSGLSQELVDQVNEFSRAGGSLVKAVELMHKRTLRAACCAA